MKPYTHENNYYTHLAINSLLPARTEPTGAAKPCEYNSAISYLNDDNGSVN